MTRRHFGHRVRRLRNILILAAHRHRRAPREDVVVQALRTACAGRALVMVIAWNTPEVIEIWIDRLTRFAPEAVPLVCDNSSKAVARQAIEALCQSKGVAYLRVPGVVVPMKHNGSRSHGMAMTWVFHHVVRPVHPPVFAFLDHDLFPLAPIDFAAMVEHQPVYGRENSGGPSRPWSLWAGFCVYRFGPVADLSLDFTPDVPSGLDTGGQNWHRLYNRLDRADIRMAPWSSTAVTLPSGETKWVERVDAFVHVGDAAQKRQRGEAFAWVDAMTTALEATLSSERASVT